jgi:hypothetical protein
MAIKAVDEHSFKLKVADFMMANAQSFSYVSNELSHWTLAPCTDLSVVGRDTRRLCHPRGGCSFSQPALTGINVLSKHAVTRKQHHQVAPQHVSVFGEIPFTDLLVSYEAQAKYISIASPPNHPTHANAQPHQRA